MKRLGNWTPDSLLETETGALVVKTMGIVYACDWEIETGQHILPASPDLNIMPFEQASGYTIQIIDSGPRLPEELIHQALLMVVYSAREQL